MKADKPETWENMVKQAYNPNTPKLVVIRPKAQGQLLLHSDTDLETTITYLEIMKKGNFMGTSKGGSIGK